MNPNDPSLSSWVSVDPSSDFPIQNLPLGIFSGPAAGDGPRVGVAIGEQVLDCARLFDHGYLAGLPFTREDLAAPSLNRLLAHGKAGTRSLRHRLSELLRADRAELRDTPAHHDALVPQRSVRMHLPVEIGDYTDFYSSEDHARNVGMMFRDPANALLPNWKHLPVGYHGRASSIVVSGTPIQRPVGQTRPNPDTPPTFGPSRLLDFELEMAFVTYPGKALGSSISTEEADDYIVGLALFNDWSARDVQAWEYVPLGPFLAKNFASTLSPWIVLLDALEPFRVAGPEQDPPVLPYLASPPMGHYDIPLEVAIAPEGGPEHVVSRSNFKYLYWNMRQQLAHHTVGGCNIRGGDLLASGTISGPTPDSFGSMLELSWRGTRPLLFPDGSERKFIEDGDTVILRGAAQGPGYRIGFGECAGKVLPSRK